MMKQTIRQIYLAILFCFFTFWSYAQSYTVMGAGTAAVNGTYTPIALSSVPEFDGPMTKIGPAYFLAATSRYLCLYSDEDGFPNWMIGNGIGVEYFQFVNSNTDPPPSSGWHSNGGALLPAPTVSVALPVELLAFSVKNMASSNQLTWQTANEVNNKGFQIERRQSTGNNWDNISFKAAGNKTSTYEFTDNAPFTTSYYRLRQIDNDGTETLSKVISIVQTGKGKGLTVYPTLVSNVLTVDYTEGSLFQVTNLLGQQVLVGKTATQIDVSSLAKGTYMLKVGSEVAKFVKQ